MNIFPDVDLGFNPYHPFHKLSQYSKIIHRNLLVVAIIRCISNYQPKVMLQQPKLCTTTMNHENLKPRGEQNIPVKLRCKKNKWNPCEL